MSPDVVEPNHVEYGDQQKKNSENATVLFMGTPSEIVYFVPLDTENSVLRPAERKNVYWRMLFIMKK